MGRRRGTDSKKLLACGPLDDAMAICEKINCTLAELPLRMPYSEYLLWVARLKVHPASSPDRWYAKILTAIYKEKNYELELPMCCRISFLKQNVASAVSRAANWREMAKTLKAVLCLKK